MLLLKVIAETLLTECGQHQINIIKYIQDPYTGCSMACHKYQIGPCKWLHSEGPIMQDHKI